MAKDSIGKQNSTPTSSPYFSSSSSSTTQTPSPKRKKISPSKKTIKSPYFSSSPTSSKSKPTRYSQDSSPLFLHGIPKSEAFYGLIQELISPNPYHILLVTSLLNVSAGNLAIPIFWKILLKYPTTHSIANADVSDLTQSILPIGLHHIRSRRLKEMGRRLWWIEKENRERGGEGFGEISEKVLKSLPGIGPYAIDSYQIFCSQPNSQTNLRKPPNAPALQEVLQQARRYELSAEAKAPLDFDPPPGWDSLEAEIPQISRNELGDQKFKQKQEEDEVDDLLCSDLSEEAKDRDFKIADKYKPGGDRATKAPKLATARESRGESSTEEDREPQWKNVLPQDKELRSYLVWRWAKEGVVWDPEKGGIVGQLESGRQVED